MNIRYPLYEGVYRILTFLSIKRQYMSCPVTIYVIEITYIVTGHFSSISFFPILLKR